MALWEDHYNIDEDFEDEEGYSSYVTAQRDALIFLVDCSRDLFQQNESGESYFGLIMRCAKCLQQNKVISSDRDLTAVVLYRTEKSSVAEIKNVFVLQDLASPDAQRIIQLEQLIEFTSKDFENKFGFSDSFSLYDALWSCQNLFTMSKLNLGFKRILLFTSDDDPHHDHTHMQRQAITKSKDLRENDVEVELIPMPKADHLPFDVSLFFKDVLSDQGPLPDPTQRFEELLTRVRSKDHKKRAQVRIPWLLSGDLSLGVGVYNLVRRCTVPAPVHLHSGTNEELKVRSRKYLSSTGEVLLPQDLKKSIEFGGRKVCFEMEEVKAIRGGLCPTGLKLLGFKPLFCLKRHHHVRPSQFIYPDEKTIVGSTILFTALLKRCLEREQFPFCCYAPRENAPPKYVALLPQDEVTDDNGVQQVPPGFHVVFLPFADDFRKIELPKNPAANESQVQAAKSLVKALKMDYDPEGIENPQVQRHYANLEALALDRDAPEQVPDLTMPNVEEMKSNGADELQHFKDVTHCQDGRKRASTTKPDSAAAKKMLSSVDIGAMAASGRLDQLTVPVLKEAIKAQNIKCSGSRKADLINAIMKHFNKS